MKTLHQTTPPYLPFARSYWVVPDRLLGGFYPGDRDEAVAIGKLNALLDCGVTHVLNLMQPTEGDHAGRPFTSYETAFLRLAEQRGIAAGWSRHPIRDLSVPSVSQMVTILDDIDSILQRNGCVYIHCWGGRGRTGTALGCWLARHREADPLSMLSRLTAHARSSFSRIPETDTQQQFVRSWKANQ